MFGSGIVNPSTSTPAAAAAAPAAIAKEPSKLGQAIKSTAQDDPGAFGQIAQGLAGVAGGLIGGRARRREQREARAELARQRQAYETFEFKDPTANLTNPFEDLTVNQQQAQFASQQQQQALAGTLSGLSGAAGGSGIAALAQTLAQQQSSNLQASAASIGAQESRNQLMRAQGQQSLEQQRAAGAAAKEAKEFGRTETLFGMAQQRKAAADEARRAATEGLVGGIANVAVGAGRIAAGGM
tara:strand:+ start:384 stop:1106 length:723 start_codon:yes stop_codon:yes gene_type:complete